LVDLVEMEEDLKMRLALNKVQVVYLNSVTDFPTWHLAPDA